jgi:hypothetical protein
MFSMKLLATENPPANLGGQLWRLVNNSSRGNPTPLGRLPKRQ